KTKNNKCIANAKFGLFGNGQGLWIFTRERLASKALVDSIKGKAEGMGLDTSLLQDVVQAGCTYSQEQQQQQQQQQQQEQQQQQQQQQ
ncbi:hypothetical protein HK102_010229, partial [Quaeritorhiza haematococci]